MSAGKGDRYRPVDRKRYEENYEKLFGSEECPIGLDDNRSNCTARTCKRCKQEKREDIRCTLPK